VTGRATVPAGLQELRAAVSYRRFLLDAHLRWASTLMTGLIVDLGGKRIRRRGEFVPTDDGQSRWVFINIDTATSPDVVSDVSAVPLPDECADCVLCTEVLEHLPNPGACVGEARRLLRPGGRLIVSVPFLYPVHADPGDFQRWTPDGLRQLLRSFSKIEVFAMGGTLGTLGLLVEIGVRPLRTRGLPMRVLGRLTWEAARLLESIDVRRGNSRGHPAETGLTTGYFVVAIK
jgi:SAM-dependent methyltransferase